jgi:uncharacterized low-complexity protein
LSNNLRHLFALFLCFKAEEQPPATALLFPFLLPIFLSLSELFRLKTELFSQFLVLLVCLRFYLILTTPRGNNMKNTKSALLATLSSSLLSGLATSAAQAEDITPPSENPFTLTELSSGYLQVAESDDKGSRIKMKDGACGEGKCGSAMMKTNEDKTVEGKCAGNKPMPKDSNKKGMEGKCGEGKCGASMNM